MRKDLQRLIPPLIEAVPDGISPELPKQRLTRFGQVLVACSIGLVGVVVYLTTWGFGKSIAERLQFCPILTKTSYPTENLESLSLVSTGDSTNMLIWNYRLNRELIRELKPATRAQRLVLNQQIASLTIRLSRQCHLVRYYRIQAGALTMLATGAAVILVVTGLIRIPKGIRDISRFEQAIFASTLTLLVVSIEILTLGDQQEQSKRNWGNHQRGLQLYSLIRTSLANDQLLLPQDSGSTAPLDQTATPLNDPEAVGELVSRIDRWLLSIDHGSVKLNNNFARQTYDSIMQGQDQQQPMNPVPSGP
jgi:hypothetical protein